MRHKDKREISGHLQIFKIYDDHQELAFDEHNLITSGMGVGLAWLLSELGSNLITDYQIKYFQAGSGAPANTGTSAFKLGGPLQTADYGTNTDSLINTHDALQNGVNVANLDFVEIPFNHITKVGDSSVRFNLFLSKKTANGLPVALDEVGLYMANPRAQSPEQSLLVAYRTHTEIQKTAEFSLLYRWVITF